MAAIYPSGTAIRYGNLAPQMQALNKVSSLNYEPQTVGGATTATPGAEKQREHYENLMAFFGVPKKPLYINPHDDYDVEHLDLPDAFEGTSITMRRVMIDQITREEQYPFRELLPLERYEQAMTIAWDVWRFNPARLNRQPEEMVPRLLSFNREQGQESMVRHGIGLMLEHTFYKTAPGRMCYVMHLQQIKNAISETMAHGVMVALINHTPARDYNDLYRQEGLRSMEGIKTMCSKEKGNWCKSQKVQGGLNLAMNELVKTLKARLRGKEGDSLVYPQGLFHLLPYQELYNLYMYTGRRGRPSEQELAKNAFPGLKLYESRGYRQADHEAPDDPNFRPQAIGNYFTMVGHHLQNVRPEHWQTEMLDTVIYSRSNDDFVKISFKEAMRFAGLYDWDEEGKPWTPLGADFFSGDRCRSEFTKEGVYDSWGDFCYHTGTLPAIVKQIMHWKTTAKKNAESKKNLDVFLRMFDPKLEVMDRNKAGSIAGPSNSASRVPSAGSYGDVDATPGSEPVEKRAGESKEEFEDRLSAQAARDLDNMENADTASAFQGEARHHHRRHHRDAEGRFESKHAPHQQHHRYHKHDAHGRFIGADDQPVSRESVYDVEKALNDRAATSNDIKVKQAYSHLVELVQHLSARENSTLGEHYRARQSGISSHKTRGASLAQHVHSLVKESDQNEHLFSTVFAKLQPALLEFDIDTSLQYVNNHPGLTNGFTALEEALWNPSETPSESTLAAANEHSPAFTLDFKNASPQRHDVAPLSLVYSMDNSGIRAFALKEYLDSEAFTLVTPYIPIWNVSKDSIDAILLSGDANIGGTLTGRVYRGKNAGDLPADPHRVAKAEFSASVSTLTSYLAHEAAKYEARVEERTRQIAARSGAPASAAAAKKKGSADEKIAEVKEDIVAEHKHFYRDLAANVLKLVATRPTTHIDKDMYEALLSETKIMEAEPLSSQFQIRAVVKAASKLVWRIITEKQAITPSHFALDVKVLFHVIRHTRSLPPDQQVPFTMPPADADADDAGDEMDEERPVGMDVRYRMGEFHGDMSHAEKAKLHADASAAMKAAYTALKEATPVEDQPKLMDIYCDIEQGGWKEFLASLYIIINREKSSNATVEQKQVIFRYFVEVFVRLLSTHSSSHPAVSYFVSAANAYPLGPTKTWVDPYKHQPVTPERVNIILDKVLAASEKHQDAHYSSITSKLGLVFDNRYIPSVITEASSLAAIEKAAGMNSELTQQIVAASYGFKPVLLERMQMAHGVRDLNNDLVELLEEESIHHAKTPSARRPVYDSIRRIVLTEFISHLPAVVVGEMTTESRKDTVVKVLLSGVFGAKLFRKAMGGMTVSQYNSLVGELRKQVDPLAYDEKWDKPFEAAGLRINEKDIVLILRKTPVSSGDFLWFCLEFNVPPPLGLIGWRPHGSFMMSTLIYMVGGGVAGRTWYGHCDFQLGNDTQRKMILGNYTMHAKPVVIFPENIALYRNIAVHDYLGGDGHEFWDCNDETLLQDYTAGHIVRDIFITAVPLTHNPKKTREMDITGAFYETLSADDDAQRCTEYFSAYAYNRHWNWKHSPFAVNSYEGVTRSEQPRANTLCFQTKQYLYNYNPAGNGAATGDANALGFGSFSLKVSDNSHWGDENIYPGCNKVCRGEAAVFEGANPNVGVKFANSHPMFAC